MISGHGTKALYESRLRDGGPGRFVRDVRHMLGLCDRRGNPYRDAVGNSILRDPVDEHGRPLSRLHPSEFGLKDLYEGIIGGLDVQRGLNPRNVFRASLYEAEHPIMEAGTGAIAASQFANINAFTATVAGLLEVSVLEGFQLPEFIGDKLMPPDNTRMFAGRKVIGVTRMGDAAEVRQPGQPTARINIGERWITQPQTVENALACVRKGTLVDTTSGPVAIEKLDPAQHAILFVAGDGLLSHTHNYRVQRTGYRSLVRVTVTDGAYLDVTGDHRFFVGSDGVHCVEASSLKEHHELWVCRHMEPPTGAQCVWFLEPTDLESMRPLGEFDEVWDVANLEDCLGGEKNFFAAGILIHNSEVTQEAVYLDLTGEVLQNASDVGTWLGYHKELRIIDAWIGVTNTYLYKNTNYATWISNGYFNNDLPNNELNHWDNIQTALLAFRDMKDPETNTRILNTPDTMLVNMEKLVVANSIVGNLAGDVQYRDAPGSTTNPQQIRQFTTPYKGKFEVLESALVFQRLTAADGLNLSASVAGKYWWLFRKGKAMKYAQNWPIRTQQAAPNQLDMIDRGIVLYIKADERGTPMIFEPRHAVRNRP